MLSLLNHDLKNKKEKDNKLLETNQSHKALEQGLNE